MKRKILLTVLLLTCAGISQQGATVTRIVCVDVINKVSAAPRVGVDRKHFLVRVDGRAATVAYVYRGLLKPKTTVLLDASGSMGDPLKWNTAVNLAVDSIKSLATSAEVSLIVFGNKKLKLDSISGAEAAITKLESMHLPVHAKRDQLVAQGRTAMRDAILFAIDNGKLKIGDALILISDGGDNESVATERELEKHLDATGVRVFCFHLGSGSTTPEERNGIMELASYSKASGGAFTHLGADSPPGSYAPPAYFLTDAERKVSSVGGDYIKSRIVSPYVLTLEVPENAKGKLKVEVVDEHGVVLKDYLVIAPERLNSSVVLPTPPS